MKKLLLLSTLLIFACSSDSSDSDDGNDNTTSELIGTYSNIINYEDMPAIDSHSFLQDCPELEKLEVSLDFFIYGFNELEECVPENILFDSYSYDITNSSANVIQGYCSHSEYLENIFFEFDVSTKVLRTYWLFDNNTASSTNWDIHEVWQKD